MFTLNVLNDQLLEQVQNISISIIKFKSKFSESVIFYIYLLANKSFEYFFILMKEYKKIVIKEILYISRISKF